MFEVLVVSEITIKCTNIFITHLTNRNSFGEMANTVIKKTQSTHPRFLRAPAAVVAEWIAAGTFSDSSIRMK